MADDDSSEHDGGEGGAGKQGGALRNFAAVPRRAAGDRNLSTRHFAVLVAICGAVDGKSGIASIALSTVAARTGISIGNASVITSALHTFGYIERLANTGRGTRSSSYRVLYDGVSVPGERKSRRAARLPGERKSRLPAGRKSSVPGERKSDGSRLPAGRNHSTRDSHTEGLKALSHSGDAELPGIGCKPSRKKPPKPGLHDLRAENFIEYAAKWAPGHDVERELEAFRNHAIANDRKVKDWPAAFRTWLMKAPQVAATRGRPNGGGIVSAYSDLGRRLNDRGAAVDRLMDNVERDDFGD